jgi:hypothetical protein
VKSSVGDVIVGEVIVGEVTVGEVIATLYMCSAFGVYII